MASAIKVSASSILAASVLINSRVLYFRERGRSKRLYRRLSKRAYLVDLQLEQRLEVTL